MNGDDVPVTTEPDAPTFREIYTALVALAGEVEADREASKRTDSSNRWKTRALLLLAIVGAVMALRAQQAIDAVEQQRAESKAGSCQQAFKEEEGDRAALVGTTRFTLERLLEADGSAPSEQEQADLDAFLDDLAVEVAELQRLRDCSPQGIDDYLTPGGPEGYLP